ncbi:MAG TPA: DUF4124 domain-containing protein [Pseudomonadales bacterium]
MNAFRIHRRLVTASLSLVLAAGALAAESRIYRTVDENGNVVFTDVPPADGRAGRTVELGPGNTFTPPPTAASEGRSLESWLGRESDEDETEGAAIRYRSLRVAGPPHDQALRDNAGNVTVTAEVDPELAPSHVIQLYLDGALQQTGHTTRFELTNVDRGTHQVELRIVDASGNTLATSEPSVFHLQRRSVLLQPAKRSGNGAP